MSSLVDAVTQAAVIAYLQARIRDWDVSSWPGQPAPSTLERQLWVRQADRPGTDDEQRIGDDVDAGRELTADEALAVFDHYEPAGQLVLLGGPGAGKTWQGYRYAREAAQTALDKLKDGSGLDDVRLPLFTTWEQWSKQPTGDPVRSLVDASFGFGPGDSLLAVVTIDRIKRVFMHPDRRVLLVLDSLDGAADRQQQTNRLHAVDSLSSWWRVVITSRPDAWDAACLGGPRRPSDQWVVELQDLDYPDDVDAFIGAWFVGDPRHGETLSEQIRNRDDLRRKAVVPLVLTFFCLLHDHPARPLPGRPRDLHHRVLRHLMAGDRTTSGRASDADRIDDCVALLTSWVWDAVRERTTSSGLGDWPDTFTPPIPLSPEQARLIDHVAPRVSDDGGTIARRFVHRTFFEHLVAEHLATLDTDQAADLLLPHLWYDPDWQVVAPAAIAAHNLHHRGALLTRLLKRIPRDTRTLDPARSAALHELDRLLLGIAAQSAPDEWLPEQQSLLERCRERHGTDVAAMIRTAHWTRYEHIVRSQLLDVLPSASPGALTRLVAELSALDPEDYARAEARSAVLDLLPTASPGVVAKLVRVLSRLHPTYTDRVRARGSVLAALSSASPAALTSLAAELSALDPTGTDRAEIRSERLAALPTTHSHDIASLVTELSALDPSDADRAEARRTLLGAFATTKPREVGHLGAALSALHPTDADLAEARHGLLGLLRTIDELLPQRADNDPSQRPWEIADLLRALSTLHPTDTELADARGVLLGALPATNPHGFAYLLDALLTLGPTDTDLAQARHELLGALPGGDARVFVRLLSALLALRPTDTDLAEARRRLLVALPAGEQEDVHVLIAALPALHPTHDDLAEARRRLLAVLPTAGPWVAARLLAALPDLDPTEPDLAEARRGLLAAIASKNLQEVDLLVEALQALARIASDPAEAREALLAALPTDHPWKVAHVTAVLPALHPTETDRARARPSLLLSLLSTHELASSRSGGYAFQVTAGGLIAALFGLVSSEADRAEARHGLLAALTDPAADPCVVADLAAALPTLHPNHDDRYEARHRLSAAFSTTDPGALDGLTRALRRLTDIDQWLTWLNGRAVDDLDSYYMWEHDDEENAEVVLRLVRQHTEAIWRARNQDDDLDTLTDRAYNGFPEPWRSMTSREAVRDHLEWLAHGGEADDEA